MRDGPYARGGKRALDLVLAAALLVALLPLMAAVAVAVLLMLGRPVLYQDRRAGRGGAAFTMLKFRSMRPGSEPDALRLTRFGRALRASGLDELPQLVNVLRGEMSLVGPRPLPPAYTPLFTPEQAGRLAVCPGVAGPGVAAGRNALGWAERLQLDAAYAAAPPRLARDLRLVLGTAWVLLRGTGARAPGHATMPAFRGTGSAATP
jgi:lipopolysaccharide/colanic/teichoic acid biosynthesis glycosyltransferase